MVFTLNLPYVHAHLLLYEAGDTHQSRNDNHADLSMTYALFTLSHVAQEQMRR
jgi:hypothetical protein